jgi:hypothetical protein
VKRGGLWVDVRLDNIGYTGKQMRRSALYVVVFVSFLLLPASGLMGAPHAEGTSRLPLEQAATSPLPPTSSSALAAPVWQDASFVVSGSPPPGVLAVDDPTDGYVLLYACTQQQTFIYAHDAYTQLMGTATPGCSLGEYYSGMPVLVYDSHTGFPTVILYSRGIPTVWTFHAGNWTYQPTTHSPPQGTYGIGAYDPTDGYILFLECVAGSGQGAQEDAQTWTYGTGGWANISGTAPVPVNACEFGTLTWDSTDGYALLSYPNDTTPGAPEDLWAFQGGSWRTLCHGCSPLGAIYQPDAGAEAHYGTDDPSLGGVVLAGPDSSWILRGTVATKIVDATGPEFGPGAAFTYVSSAGYVLLWGGVGTYGYSDNVTLWLTTSPFSTSPVTFRDSPANLGEIDVPLDYTFNTTGTNTSRGSHVGPVPSGTSLDLPNGTYIVEPWPEVSTFLGWSTSGALSLSGYHLRVSGPGTLTANYAPDYTVVLQGEEPCGGLTWNGSSPNYLQNPQAPPGAVQVTAGSYTLSVATCSSSTFLGWLSSGSVGLASPSSPETVLTVTGNGTVETVFSGSGSGIVIEEVEERSEVVGGLDDISLEMEENEGNGNVQYSWSGLPGDCTGASGTGFSCTSRETGSYTVDFNTTGSNGAWTDLKIPLTVPAGLQPLPPPTTNTSKPSGLAGWYVDVLLAGAVAAGVIVAGTSWIVHSRTGKKQGASSREGGPTDSNVKEQPQVQEEKPREETSSGGVPDGERSTEVVRPSK